MMSQVDKQKRKTLLVIDDDPDMTEVISELLTPLNAQVLVAGSAGEGLKMFDAFSIDAVLSDVRMPGMTGIEMMESIRGKGHPTPFVMMSGFISNDNTLAALRLGVIDVLPKPFDPNKLVSTIGVALHIGASMWRLQRDLLEFCKDRAIDQRYIDMVRYVGIYMARQELLRAKEAV